MRKIFKAESIHQFVGGSSVGTIASIHSVLGVTFIASPLMDGIIKGVLTIGVAFATGLATAIAGQLIKRLFKDKGKDEGGE